MKTGAPHSAILLAHSYFLCRDAKQQRRMKPYPPLATLIAAAVLRQHRIEVSFFDAMLASGVDEFVTTVQRTRPEVVALLEDNFNYVTKMCTTRMREAALEMVAAAHAVGARVVVNGSDASDAPLPYLEAGADVVILGETEITLPELLRAWRDREAVDDIAGLVLLPSASDGLAPDPDGLCRTPNRGFVEDLDSLPLPAWDLVDAELYRQAWHDAHGRLSWNMVTTRGCPFDCSWCAKPLYGRRYAQRSPANVVQELEVLRRSVAPDHIWFADDIFGLTDEWIAAFADEVCRRGLTTAFTAQARVDLITQPVAVDLQRAGAEEVWLGVETAAQDVLDSMRKGITTEQIRAATRNLRAAGVRPSWFLQLGYPGEEWQDIAATRDLVREERPHDVGVSVAYPLPGTSFYEEVRSQITAKTNWTESGDLAVLFQGAFTTELYRRVRDLLHDEAVVALLGDAQDGPSRRRALDDRWRRLEGELGAYRRSPSASTHEGASPP